MRDSFQYHPLPARLRAAENTRALIHAAAWPTLIALTIAAFALRWHQISSQSLWWDEGYSVFYGSLPLAEMFKTLHEVEVNPPLYYVLIHYWMKAFGNSELSVRMLSTIFGLASLPVMYAIGVVLRNRTTGLLAAMLLAFSSMHVQYAQEARTYTFLVFLSLLSMLLFLRLLQNPTAGRTAAYIAATLLLPYAHVYGTLIILAQNAWMLLLLLRRDRPRVTLRHWLIIQLILGALLIPFAIILLHNVHKVQKGFWIPRPSIFTLIEALLEYTGLQQLIPDSWTSVAKHHKRRLVMMLVLLGMIAITLLSAYVLRRFRKEKLRQRQLEPSTQASPPPWLFLTLWAAVVILLPFIWSRIGTPMFVSRYAMAASCALYLLAALWLESLVRRGFIGVLISAAIACISLCSVNAYYDDTKAPWREATAYLDTHASPGDLVLVSRPLPLKLLLNYYSRRNDLDKRPITDPDEPVNEQTAEQMLDVTRGRDRVWLVYYHPNDPKKLLVSHLARRYKQVITPFDQYSDFDDVTVKLFVKDPTAASAGAGEIP